jgi:hypothetical protein
MGGEALLQGGNGLCSTGLPWLVSLLAWSQCGGAEAEKRSFHLCFQEKLRDAAGVWRRRWLDVAVAGAFWKEKLVFVVRLKETKCGCCWGFY